MMVMGLWGCDVDPEPCARTFETIDLAEAEATVGVDASSEADRVAALDQVSWAPMSSFLTFELSVGEPEGLREEEVEGCSDPVTIVRSTLSGSIYADGYFVAAVDGEAVYDADGTTLSATADVTTVEEGLTDMVSEGGTDISVVESYFFDVNGTVAGGTLDLVADFGADQDTAATGAWLPAE